MTVAIKIKTAPDVSQLGPVHSTYNNTKIFVTPTPAHTFNPLPVSQASKAASVQPPAVSLTFVRNNRVFGYYSDIIQAKLSLDYLIQRENEFGADV